MADSSIDPNNGLPKSVSLGDVLAKIELSPAHAAEFIRNLAYNHLGGAHDELGRNLLTQANAVADPQTYGGATPEKTLQEQQADAQARWAAGSPAPGSPPPAVPSTVGSQYTGAAQGQSALPPSGTTNEPSWMADARAAGWQSQTPSEPAWMAEARKAGWNPQGDKPSTPTFQVSTSQGRHFDNAQGKWVDDATGQPVDVGDASESTTPQAQPLQ